MNDEMAFDVEQPPTQASNAALTKALREYNAEAWGEPGYEDVGFFLRDAAGQLQAGLTGRYRWGWMFVEKLWVTAGLRRQGVGSRLLGSAEAFARERGGVAIHLDAADPPSLRFYAKHGFEEVGRMPGFPPGHTHRFLRKWLQAAEPSSR